MTEKKHEFTIISDEVPKGALVTQASFRPRIFCCISGDKANVYKGKTVIRKFQHFENGLKKQAKVLVRVDKAAANFYIALTKNGPLYLRGYSGTGFDNVV
jgi:hypothetical protein